MDRYKKYQIAIWVLSLVIIIQLVFIISLARPKKIPKAPPLVKGKIAIVVDDWGYNFNNFALLKQIRQPLTLAVLPNLPYSKRISEEAASLGLEVILHLPLEPLEKFRLEKATITSDMDDATVAKIIKKDLDSVPTAKGVSNHMGSQATRDIRVMSTVFKELKKRNLYFLDSFVTSSSVCSDLAEMMHLRFAERDIFLDNKEEPQYINKQIEKLKMRSRLYGQAIGIGHDHKVTLGLLKEVMPRLEKEGYKFVFISELTK